MLILTPQEIEYCQLSESRSDRKRLFSAIKYQGILFVKIASFTINQLTEAIAICKEFLEEGEAVPTIIVSEADRITLWSIPDRSLSLNF
ncbi:MAG: hypothetical protein ACFBSE_22110 [Prochloraceae cyanobacterium]